MTTTIAKAITTATILTIVMLVMIKATTAIAATTKTITMMTRTRTRTSTTIRYEQHNISGTKTRSFTIMIIILTTLLIKIIMIPPPTPPPPQRRRRSPPPPAMGTDRLKNRLYYSPVATESKRLLTSRSSDLAMGTSPWVAISSELHCSGDQCA